MKLVIVSLILVILLVLAGCKEVIEETPEELICEIDDDCVKSSCCHSDSCINKDYAPDCFRVMCTLDCKPNTLDCGQGSCVCENSKCTAKIE